MTYKFTCEYNGANYCGFQRQKNGNTIQAELESALEKYFNQKITIHASGRTDTGVHARNQTCSFQYVGAGRPCRTVELALNSFLPHDISIRNLEHANETFNARFDAKRKTYSYKCYVSPHRSPLRNPYMLQLYKQPCIETAHKRAGELIGTHDFTKFSSANTDKENKVRTIYSLDIKTHFDEIHILITANGFLRKMARRIVSHLLNLNSTAPAHGLCLESVEY